MQQHIRLLTLFSSMRCMRTKHQATTKVSTEFENVRVCRVQVTYEEATRSTAPRRRRGDCTNSWIAQSSRTKLSVNINILKTQYTTEGATSPSPAPSHSQRRRYIGRP